MQSKCTIPANRTSTTAMEADITKNEYQQQKEQQQQQVKQQTSEWGWELMWLMVVALLGGHTHIHPYIHRYPHGYGMPKRVCGVRKFNCEVACCLTDCLLVCLPGWLDDLTLHFTTKHNTTTTSHGYGCNNN